MSQCMTWSGCSCNELLSRSQARTSSRSCMKMCCALAIEAVALNDIEHFWYAKMQLMWRPRITLSETIPLQMYSTDSACQLSAVPQYARRFLRHCAQYAAVYAVPQYAAESCIVLLKLGVVSFDAFRCGHANSAKFFSSNNIFFRC